MAGQMMMERFKTEFEAKRDKANTETGVTCFERINAAKERVTGLQKKIEKAEAALTAFAAEPTTENREAATTAANSL